MKKLFSDWTRVVLIVVPLCVIVFDAAVLFAEWRQTDAEKAVRLVRESKSRKENFTVQQFLYATVYHRREKGEAVTIEGWRVEPDAASAESLASGAGDFLVSFVYTDAGGKHTALWQANPKTKRIISKNEAADELSWH